MRYFAGRALAKIGSLRKRDRVEVPLHCTSLAVSSRTLAHPTKLMIVAHPDDESLFGGEALTSSRGWTVVSVTGASNGLRRSEFTQAMLSIGANFTMLDHFDHLGSGNFHTSLREQLTELLREYSYDLVVTHNAAGEYGHPQHKGVHALVRSLVTREKLYVFDARWMMWARMSDAKRALIAHYASQQASVKFVWPLACRERLRKLS